MAVYQPNPPLSAKRSLNIVLTVDQYRALAAAVRLARAGGLIRRRSLPALARAWEAIEAAWEARTRAPTTARGSDDHG
jgi:hypothetical protein